MPRRNAFWEKMEEIWNDPVKRAENDKENAEIMAASAEFEVGPISKKTENRIRSLAPAASLEAARDSRGAPRPGRRPRSIFMGGKKTEEERLSRFLLDSSTVTGPAARLSRVPAAREPDENTVPHGPKPSRSSLHDKALNGSTSKSPLIGKLSSATASTFKASALSITSNADESIPTRTPSVKGSRSKPINPGAASVGKKKESRVSASLKRKVDEAMDEVLMPEPKRR